ncbi:MAG: TIGR02530 family flagellar biosynthesis protein [Fimbriimonadaceae bacterium]
MDARIQNARIAERIAQQPVAAPRPNPAAGGVQAPDFQALLQDRLKVSGHAQTRLQSREIQLGKEEWERVLSGVERAAQKGARESLVMLDDVALVVSIRNRTVITAVDKQHLKDNVFTNIDSAVIV